MPAKKTVKKTAKKPANKAMTESQFCENLAMEMGVSKADAKKFLAAQQSTIAKGLKKHGAVTTDMGKMQLKSVPAKKGGKKMYMPALGREIVTKDKPASKKVKFAPKKRFKDLF